jgi:predicted RNA-binding protein with PIN domain
MRAFFQRKGLRISCSTPKCRHGIASRTISLVFFLILYLTEAFYRDAPIFGRMVYSESFSEKKRQIGCFDSSLMPLFMGKGDGKTKHKHKKKKTPSANPPSASTSSHSQPLRVTNDINVPIRHQIQMARINKQQQSTSGSSFRQRTRTAYRRAMTEEEAEEKALQRKRRGQEPDWEVILSRNRTSPLLMVDGYNIIHRWPRLKKHMLKGDPARARQLLIEDLENLKIIRGWRIEVVFDGTRRNTVGPLGQSHRGPPRPSQADKEAKASMSKHGVRIVYSGIGTEADSYIEAKAHRAENVTRGEMTSSFIIATDDSMIRLAGQDAGAVCMSADSFINELKAAKESIGYLVEAAVAQVNGHVIRPEKLRGTSIHTFGRGSVLIVDKRNRTKVPAKAPEVKMDIDIKYKEIQGLHWIFVPPNRSSHFS